MKKLLAIALCLMLLLSGCTYAADGVNTALQLRDLTLITGPDNITDLSGLSLTVESAGTEDAAGFRLTLEDDNGPLSVALTGRAVTPGGAVEIARILGRDESLRRIKFALENN